MTIFRYYLLGKALVHMQYTDRHTMYERDIDEVVDYVLNRMSWDC